MHRRPAPPPACPRPHLAPPAFGSLDQRLLQHIYTAMDESGRGWVSFRQFACALSTVFRGEKEDVLDFWFRMYDTDRWG